MKIKWIGTHSAFAFNAGPGTEKCFQSSFVVERGAKKLCVDFGGTGAAALREHYGVYNADLGDIDAFYITHLHADHIAGLEHLALCTYYNPNARKPKLFGDANLLDELWSDSLAGGLKTIENKDAVLGTFFDVYPIERNGGFVWEGVAFWTVQSVHIVSGRIIRNSYGLIMSYIEDPDSQDNELRMLRGGVEEPTCGETIYFTSDTQFCPNQIQAFYSEADIIFQDGENTPYKSNVHAHYNDLKTLPLSTREKMWLFHYAPGPNHEGAKKDGFAGFIEQGQEFEIHYRQNT